MSAEREDRGYADTDGTDPEEADGLPSAADALDDDGDVLDRGWSPPDRPWAAEDWGTTEREEAAGEGLAGRLAREMPDGTPDTGDGLGDATDTDGELRDDEVGDRRAGRLSAGDGAEDGDPADTEDELYATDAGIDGGAASAEEAAVHVVGERYLPDLED